MQNKTKSKLLATCAVVSALALGVGGTLAYLTDNETHTNTFTVGNVHVDLLEPSWPQADENKNGVPDAAEDLVPNEEVAKDPKVQNTGENDAIVFMRVTVPMKDVSLVADDGTVANHAVQELFYMKQNSDAISVHNNNFNPNWIELTSKEVTYQDPSANPKTGQKVYVFGYKTALKGNNNTGEPVGEAALSMATTDPLFEKVQLKNILENEIDSDQIQNIKVETFAIQADNIIASGAAVDPTGNLDSAKLGTIYDIFVKQNGQVDAKGDMKYTTYQNNEHGAVEKEADNNGAKNLKGGATATSANEPATVNSTTGAIKTLIRATVDKSVLSANMNNTTPGVAETAQMTVTIQQRSDNYTNFSYVSSDPTVATVDASGKITAVGIGDCTISAVTNDGAKATVHISVQRDSRQQDKQVDANDQVNDPQGTSEPSRP